MRYLYLILLICFSSLAYPLSFEGKTCKSINVSAQLAVTCSTDESTTTVITPVTPTQPTPTQQIATADTCVLTGTYEVGASEVYLSVTCPSNVVSYKWNATGCSSSRNTCTAYRFIRTVYSVIGVTKDGIEIPSNKIAL